MSFCTVVGSRGFRVSLVEYVAGTTGLEPATSAVTAKRKPVTIRNKTPRMAIFGANRDGQEQIIGPLMDPRPLPCSPLPRPGIAGREFRLRSPVLPRGCRFSCSALKPASAFGACSLG